MSTKKKLLYILCYFPIAAYGNSLVIKAAIGQGSFLALQVALSNWLGINVGTIYVILSAFLFFFCFLLDRQKKWSDYLLMLVAIFSFGWLTNFFVYGLFGNLNLDNYLFKLGYFLLGLVIMGMGLGKLLKDELVTFPLEKVCLLSSKQTTWSFTRYRYLSDIFCISLALFVSLLKATEFSIREGTFLSMLLLPGLLAFFKK
ncbi:YitT family protein [Streptococcus pasteurianus]|uniref:YitT family protein n=1 Tax=Streptococcus pasteurianus TaxID=197614 RepID=UPI0023799E25|nr:YitT family protein [Streptococcus pasteurianus]MDY5246282.1 YitT family protein [Ligilactobacillus salivarius]MDY5270492.1 YitT family protein [Streptococcus sp.]MDV5151779.1 YitT family protein [Streptococcus pasteurianus]WCQ72143.1 YitT family protein [Streptococcus pasteurianus]WOO57463.1 YitT family protein [Streptococcus pasteurianus]